MHTFAGGLQILLVYQKPLLADTIDQRHCTEGM